MNNKRIKRLETFKKKVPKYRKNPVLFCKEVLKVEPDEWQQKVLNDLAGNSKVSVRSGQGVGKTGLESWVLLWFLTCFPFPKVIATAPTRQQLHDILWAEVNKWQTKSPILKKILKWTKTKIYMRKYEERWFATARTATRPENMQGFHEDNMLFIIDEASGVADPIMEAILGTLSGENNKLLMCGNPTKTSGVFYDSHHRDRGMYKAHKVSSRNSKRTNKENIQALERKYGKDSNVVRVRVDGEFPTAEDDVFIPISFVEQAVMTELNITEIQTVDIGVDVARYGDDETVIATKLNQQIQPLTIKNGQDLMRTASDTIMICKKIRDKYQYTNKIIVKIDDTGLGGGVTDRLLQIKKEESLEWLEVIPVNFSKGIKHKYYADITTYLWSVVRDLLGFKENEEDGDCQLILPDDNELIAQFSVRKYEITSKTKIKIESKKEMKARGIKSPDRADAVALACMPTNISYEMENSADQRHAKTERETVTERE